VRWGFYILDSCFVLGFLYGLVFWAEVSMWTVRHWAVGLRAVARHWGLSMPSKVASLPSHVSMLFFGLVYWATISLASTIWSMPSFFCAGEVSLRLWVMV